MGEVHVGLSSNGKVPTVEQGKDVRSPGPEEEEQQGQCVMDWGTIPCSLCSWGGAGRQNRE